MSDHIQQHAERLQRIGKALQSDVSGAQRSHELPHDLLRQATKRLRIITILFAFTFFMADFFSPIAQGEASAFFSRFYVWGPGAISIATALVVLALTYTAKCSPQRIMDYGLIFGALGAYGIACAEFIGYVGMHGLDTERFFGLSWVAIWTLFFVAVIPNKPYRSLIAAVVASSAVPVVIGIVAALSDIEPIASERFFFGVIFPYILTTLLAYVAARVFYRLGTDVTKAREMGSYRLTKRLGVGGMGEVWEARHRMLARPAAIKVVRPDALAGAADTPESILKRFAREAQATSLMRSPHTIDIYDFGISNDGVFYYVMELLDGLELGAVVDKTGALPPERVIHLLKQVCHSLSEAHEKGLIHRDIKPANVFACRYGRDADFIKVLDFGLVRFQRDSIKDDKLTAANVVTGTPAYMSPEQVVGDKPLDVRSDIYAVACLAYYLLTATSVFEGTPMEVMMKHVRDKPAPLTDGAIPSDLARLIMTCLAKDPAERVQSAEQLSHALDSIPTRETWTQERALDWWNEHVPPRVIEEVPAASPLPTDFQTI